MTKEAQQTEREREILSDIEAMDNAFNEQVEEVEVSSEEEARDQVVAEAGAEDLVKELQDSAETEVESTEEKSAEEAKPDDEYDFSFINELARQALGKQTEVVQPVQEQPVVQSPQAQPVAQPSPQTQLSSMVAPQDLVSLDEMRSAFESPEKMIELIGKVYIRARADATQDAVQTALMSLPNVVRPLLVQEASLAEMVKTFYVENPELDGYRDFVQYCATQVESAHPDWSPKQVMAETAKVAKGRLPALREAVQRERKQVKPSFVDQKSTTNKPSAKQVSRLERELAAMPDY
jgi:hypothetical protein